MAFSITVVVATYNRQMALERLLGDLSRQDLSPGTFEVVVVDDGSTPRVAPRLKENRLPFAFRLLEQANAGPGAARHKGVLAATGDLVVFLDDDMQVEPEFLSAHLEEHARHGRAVILGIIKAPVSVDHLALSERFHLDSLQQLEKEVRAGQTVVRGLNLCTGNVSMRREDYLLVGGFDRSLRESEDRDLGIRLEMAGVPLFMSEIAQSTHATDHGDLKTWLDRSRRYGRNDLKIHVKNQAAADTNPWRFLFMVSPLSRPLLMTVTARPSVGRRLSLAVMAVAGALDHPPLSRVALKLTTLAYGVEYFSGLGEEAGSIARSLHGLAEELANQRGAAPATLIATANFMERINMDAAAAAKHRAQYHPHKPEASGLARNVAEQIGLQMMAAVRLMPWFLDMGSPLGARVCSRMIRHIYGAEIHWDATFEPGISLVHGVGLVVSHAARVDAGCILFHNVTLGEGLHPDTKERGSPHLEHDVHVGPGCTLLGPITVGAGSKLMAGCVLNRSVGPRSLVVPAPVAVTERLPPTVALPSNGKNHHPEHNAGVA